MVESVNPVVCLQDLQCVYTYMYFPLAGETVPTMVKLSIIVAVLLVVVGYSGAGPAPSPPDGLDVVSR